MTHTLTLPSICRSVTYILWSKDFALYLEDYLMEKRCTWENGSLWLKGRPCKIYVGQRPIFHGPLILPYIIVRLKLFLYIKKWHPPGTCSSSVCSSPFRQIVTPQMCTVMAQTSKQNKADPCVISAVRNYNILKVDHYIQYRFVE